MLKLPITFENLDGETVTQDFHFNMTKLEMMEADLSVGGFEEAAALLTKTTDGKKAYALFKEIILATYGVRDGQDFVKSDELTARFATSPALSELIISFLEDPTKAITFIKAVLPASVGKMISEDELIAASGLTPTPVEVAPPRVKVSQKDLMSMSKEELVELMKAKAAE